MKKRGFFESKKHYDIRKKISEALYVYVSNRSAPILTKVTQNISTITIIRTNNFEVLEISEKKFKKILKKYFNKEFFRYVFNFNKTGDRHDILYISLTKPLYYEIIHSPNLVSPDKILILAQNKEALKHFTKKSFLLSYSFWNTEEIKHQRKNIVVIPIEKNIKNFLQQYSVYFPDLANEILLLLEVE